MALHQLLKNGTDVGVGGISGEGQLGRVLRMVQWCGLHQGQLGRLEGGGHGRGPLQVLGVVGQGVSEGEEDGSGLGDETALKINQTQEPLQVLDGGQLGEDPDGLHMGGEGGNPSSSDMMS